MSCFQGKEHQKPEWSFNSSRWDRQTPEPLEELLRLLYPEGLYLQALGTTIATRLTVSQEFAHQTEPETSLINTVENVLRSLRSLKVLVPRPSEVREYLREYNDIIDLVYFVSDITRNKFGDGAQLAFEIFRDPESDYRNLSLYVRKERYEDDILDKFEELDCQYNEILSNKKGYILVTTDFSKPKLFK